MGKLFRLYNQNRKKVWTIIIIIIFAFMIISLFNNVYKMKNQEENEKVRSESDDTPKYYNESKSMVTGGNVPKSLRKDFGDLVNNFLTYCQNHEPEKAYGLLSEDCKELLYQTEEKFEEQYYKPKFSIPVRFSFQSYTASDTYIYMVKIFYNMLATGMGSSEQYIEDYISIVQESGTYKINIDGFIGSKDINKEKTKDDITIKINKRYIYMDNSVYTIKIINNTENVILLDSGEKTDSVYVVDQNKIKFQALLYEVLDEDLEIKPKEEKEIQIKFTDSYKENIPIKQMVFSDICIDKNNEENKIEMKINL